MLMLATLVLLGLDLVQPSLDGAFVRQVAVKAVERSAAGVKPAEADGDEAGWVRSDDYPAIAMQNRWTGITATVLSIGTDGRVTACRITEPSGHGELDQAACTALTERARFRPARDQAGQPVPGTFSRRVVWQLPPHADDADPPTPGAMHFIAVTIRAHATPAGTIDACTVTLAENGYSIAHPQQPSICARFSAGYRPFPTMPVPPQGMWIENRQLTYFYAENPQWTDGDDAAGAAEQAPTPAEPLPDGVT